MYVDRSTSTHKTSVDMRCNHIPTQERIQQPGTNFHQHCVLLHYVLGSAANTTNEASMTVHGYDIDVR